MLKLTDTQLAALMAAARRIPPELRGPFMRRISNALAQSRIDDATLHIAITNAMRAMSPMRRGTSTFGVRGRRYWA